MTIYLTEVSRERALIERARWVGLRLDVTGEPTASHRYRVVDPMTGTPLPHPGVAGPDLRLTDAEEIIELHSKPARLGN